MLDLAPADDGENVGGFVHDVGEGDGGDGRRVRIREFLERGRDGPDLFRRTAHFAAFIFLLFECFCGSEIAPPQSAPWCQGHAFSFAHGQDVSLKVAHGGAPVALVDAELGEAMVAGVLIRFADDPGWGIADAEVENFSSSDDVVEGLHEFGNRGGKVPPVDVEEVDVVCLEFLQTRFEGDF